MQRLVCDTIILCYDGDFAPCTTRNIGQFSECSVKCKKFYNHLKFLVD